MNRDHPRPNSNRLAAAAAVVLALLGAAKAHAQSTAPTSTTASIGLLPVHAIAVDLDRLPGAGKGKDGEVAALQKLWDSFLKGAGFNVIEFDVDARDLGDRGAGRVAKLCLWAKQNDVRLAPTLIGAPEGKPLPPDYADLAASFVGKVIAELGPAGINSYSQIVFYQLERSLNQPASHGPMETAVASKLLEAAARSVRAAEQVGLAQSGMQPTPLLVPASFDYELIRRGAIAQTPISDESYGQAYDGMRDYLLGVLGSASAEAVSVQWFPGSLSSEGVDRLPDLVNRLQSDLPGKLLIVDTGYSSAAGSDTAQARYYQTALNNLCDLRANQGVDSPFAGVVWRSAVDGDGEVTAIVAQPRAADVTKVWNDPKADGKEARSWLKSVQSNFGLLQRSRDSNALAPKVAFRVMSSLESALSQSPQASDALAAARELAEAGKTGGMGQAIKSRLQNALFGVLDAWVSKSTTDLFATPNEAPPPAPGMPAQLPDVQVIGTGALPATATAGTVVLIPVTLFNAGSAVATDAVVYLRDGQQTDLARTNPFTISPGGQTSVELRWTPLAAGTVQNVSAETFCSNDADPSPGSNRMDLGNLEVKASGGGGGGGHTGPKWAGVMADIGSRTLVMSSASPSTSPPPPGGSAPTQGRVMMATSSGAGFATIESMSAPSMMMAPAPGTPPAPGTGSARALIAPPPSSGASPAGVARAMTPAREPVTMTLANPFRATFNRAVATLFVDDAKVSTRQLGTLLPGQRRTVTFTEWSPPRPGTFRLRADLEGQGALGNPLKSSATSTITVAGPEAAPRSAPMAGGSPRSITATRSFTPLVQNVSPIAVRPLGAGSQFPGAAGGARSFMSAPALRLSANDILLRPFPPAAGAPVTITVQLSNVDRMPVHGARVAVTAGGQPLGEMVIDVPASGMAIASGFKEWTAANGRHDIRASVTVGSSRSEATKPVLVTGPQGARGFGRPAIVAGGGLVQTGKPVGVTPAPATKVGVGFQTGFKPSFAGQAAGAADLQIQATDIRIAPPLPSAGAAMTVTIQVRNLGAAPASDGRVLAVLTAGGAEVARKQFMAVVPAGGVVALEWPLTAPAGTPLVVSATATARGDANPANNQARATAAIKVMPKVRALESSRTIGITR